MPEYDLHLELNMKDKLLSDAVQQMRTTGSAFALAERDYKLLLRTAALRLRDQGYAVGMINLMIYGEPEVAAARFERDCKETEHKAVIESIQMLKLQMRLIESQIQREWGQAGR